MANGNRTDRPPSDFGDLVSDISDVSSPPPKVPARSSQPSQQAEIPSAVLANEVGSGSATSTPGRKSSDGAKGWLVIGGIILGLVILANIDDKPSKKSSSSSTATSSSWGDQTSEERPAVGHGNVLSYPQIRYCLAEDIRLSTLQPLINSYSDLEVAFFNAAIDDYNKRCSNFRYRSGSLETVRSQVEARRTELRSQARQRLEQWRR